MNPRFVARTTSMVSDFGTSGEPSGKSRVRSGTVAGSSATRTRLCKYGGEVTPVDRRREHCRTASSEGTVLRSLPSLRVFDKAGEHCHTASSEGTVLSSQPNQTSVTFPVQHSQKPALRDRDPWLSAGTGPPLDTGGGLWNWAL